MATVFWRRDHLVFNHVTERHLAKVEVFLPLGVLRGSDVQPFASVPSLVKILPQSAIAGEKGARIGAVAKRRLRPGDAATAGERGLLDG